ASHGDLRPPRGEADLLGAVRDRAARGVGRPPRRPRDRAREPRLPLRGPHPIRARPRARALADRPCRHRAAGPSRSALAVMRLEHELGVGALALVVLLVGLAGGARRGREVGLIAAIGLAGLYGLSLVIDARGPLFDGAFVVDGLAVFLK